MKVDEKGKQFFFKLSELLFILTVWICNQLYQFHFIYSMVCDSTFLRFRDSWTQLIKALDVSCALLMQVSIYYMEFSKSRKLRFFWGNVDIAVREDYWQGWERSQTKQSWTCQERSVKNKHCTPDPLEKEVRQQSRLSPAVSLSQRLDKELAVFQDSQNMLPQISRSWTYLNQFICASPGCGASLFRSRGTLLPAWAV